MIALHKTTHGPRAVLFLIAACASPSASRPDAVTHVPDTALVDASSPDGSPDADLDAPPRSAVFHDVTGLHPDVTLEMPDSWDGQTPLPLFMLLNGYSASTGSAIVTRFGLTDLRNHPAFVLNPTGALDSHNRHYWNASHACCDLDGRNNDDVAYLGSMVEYFEAQGWPIDRSRVFLIGHSNGDFMVERLLCERADLFAAGWGLAGAANDNQGTDPVCAPSQPISYMHAHGTADTEVPYNINGNISTMPATFPPVEPSASTNATMLQWTHVLGCTGSLTLVQAGAFDYDGTIARAETDDLLVGGCPAGVTLELRRVNGGDHLLHSAFTPAWTTDIVAWLLAHHR